MLADEQMFFTREELTARQLERLRGLLERLHRDVPFYRDRLDAKGLVVSDIKTLADVERIPFTTAEDIRTHGLAAILAWSGSPITKLHVALGRESQPLLAAFTPSDTKRHARLIARSLECAGVKAGMRVATTFGAGLFSGGEALTMAVESLDAAVADFPDESADVLVSTPFAALGLAEELGKQGRDPHAAGLKVGVISGAPWSEAMRAVLEKVWGFRVFDFHSRWEVMGGGIAVECEGRHGLHIWADEFLPEVVDLVTGEPLEEGWVGELVLTTLNKEALPLVRYRTGDITSLTYAPCPSCRRLMPRMKRVHGTLAARFLFKGVEVFPTDVEDIILRTEGLSPQYRLVIEDEPGGEQLIVEVEPAAGAGEGTQADHTVLIGRLCDEVEGALGVATEAKLLAQGTIDRAAESGERTIRRVRERRSAEKSRGEE